MPDAAAEPDIGLLLRLLTEGRENVSRWHGELTRCMGERAEDGRARQFEHFKHARDGRTRILLENRGPEGRGRMGLRADR